MSLSNEATRARIYRVLLALQPLVVAYGLVSSERAGLILAVISAALGSGLASANTSTKTPEGDQ